MSARKMHHMQVYIIFVCFLLTLGNDCGFHSTLFNFSTNDNGVLEAVLLFDKFDCCVIIEAGEEEEVGVMVLD
jgi:hypothetical protein